MNDGGRNVRKGEALRKISKTSRVPRSPLETFSRISFKEIYAGRGAQLSQPVGLEILHTELFGTATELFGKTPNYNSEKGGDFGRIIR